MYIPTWILIVIIIGITFYYLRKRQSGSFVSNKNNPTYDEMLKMNGDDFKKWIIVRSEKPNREKLLQEMTDHETRTHSFAKTARAEITPTEQAVLNVFNKDKSVEVADFLDRLSKIASEDGSEEKDLVQDAIFAKAASDHVGLGAKMEKERK